MMDRPNLAIQICRLNWAVDVGSCTCIKATVHRYTGRKSRRQISLCVVDGLLSI